jgi:hypothetical protein
MSQLKVNSIIPTAGVPSSGGTNYGGGIIKIVHRKITATSNVTTTSTSFTNLSSAYNTFITPTSSSSKIYVIITAPVVANNSYNGGIADYSIGRDGSMIDSFSYGSIYQNASGLAYQNLTMHTLDSPNTTSQVGYNFMCKTNGSDAVGIGAYGANEIVSVTLMEVSGS